MIRNTYYEITVMVCVQIESCQGIIQIIASERHVSSVFRLPIAFAVVFTGIIHYRAQRATEAMSGPAVRQCVVLLVRSVSCVYVGEI